MRLRKESLRENVHSATDVEGGTSWQTTVTDTPVETVATLSSKKKRKNNLFQTHNL